MDSKFQTPYCPVKTREKFPSIMVYVIISPNYTVYAFLVITDTQINQKGKVPVRRRKFFRW
jgi:hypothetical protein